jgi:cell division protein FtsL
MAQTAYRYDFGYDANAAVQPKKQPQVHKQPELKVIVNPLAKEIAREKEVNKMALKLSALMASLLVIMSVFCYSFVLMNDAQHSLTDMENQLKIHQAQNQELKAELNALVAGVDIERYAVEKLGLIKVSNENEVYLNNETENKIIFSAKTE